MRAELSSLKVGAANGLNEAQAPLLNRVKELEKEVEKEVSQVNPSMYTFISCLLSNLQYIHIPAKEGRRGQE